MGPLGFGEKLLWIGFVGPDRCMVKALSQFRSGPVRSSTSSTRHVGAATSLPISGAGTTVALLLTRPGRGGDFEADRRWSKLLTEAAARFDVPLEPIFRANDEALVQLEAA